MTGYTGTQRIKGAVLLGHRGKQPVPLGQGGNMTGGSGHSYFLMLKMCLLFVSY